MQSLWKILPCCVAMLSPLLADTAVLGATSAQTGALQSCVAAQAEKLDFSGSVLIAQGGQVTTYVRGDTRVGGAPITIGSRFNIGSAGKMFTAVAVGQLIDAGKVELDAPIGRYVDGLTTEASAVTVRQLLSHSSGLGNFFTPDNLAVIESAGDLNALKPLVVADVPSFTPGSQFAYSNSGFLLLGLMIESVTGQAYAAYLTANIFAPAGMAATSLDAGGGSPSPAEGMTGMRPAPLGAVQLGAGGPPGPSQRAGGIGDRPPPGGPGLQPPLDAGSQLRPSQEAALRGSPAGGAFSTVQDLWRFFIALQSGRLVKMETVRRLSGKQIVSGPARGNLPELGYGFGFGTSSFEGHRWYGHNGGAPGLNAEAVVFPEDDVAIFILANRDPPMATELLRVARAQIFTGECAAPDSSR